MPLPEPFTPLLLAAGAASSPGDLAEGDTFSLESAWFSAVHVGEGLAGWP